MRLRSATGALVALVALIALAAPAAAHGGGAVFEVLEASEVAPGRIALRVLVTHEADGDPAAGAIVEVAATGPGDAAVAPVQAVRQEEEGVYATSVDVAEPGAWTLVVTSSFPPGTTVVPVEVRGAAGGTTTTTAPAAAPTTGPVLAAPEVGGVEGGSDTANLVSAAVFGVIGGALGLWVSRRRSARRAAAEADRSDAA